MVNPCGTGSLSTDVISARLAPLPPRRSLSSIGGRGCVWSKSKTYGIGPPCPGPPGRVASAALRGRAHPDLGRAKPAYFPRAFPSGASPALIRPLTQLVTTPTTPSSFPSCSRRLPQPSSPTVTTDCGYGDAVLLDLVVRRLGVPAPVLPHAAHLALEDL